MESLCRCCDGSGLPVRVPLRSAPVTIYVDSATGTTGGGSACERTLMKYFVAVLAVLVIAIGVAGVVYGEADDSPGLQGLGVLLVLGAVALAVRTVRRSR